MMLLRTNNELVDDVERRAPTYLDGSSRSRAVLAALRAVDRAAFFPTPVPADLAYSDDAISIGEDQTCSQPSMVAFICDILELKKGMRVLEIGTGCAYHAAITSELIGKTGLLKTIEIIPQLAHLAYRNLTRHFGDSDTLDARVHIHLGNARALIADPDFHENKLFDRIYLTAGVRSEIDFMRHGFDRLLSPDGIIVFPEQEGILWKYSYRDSNRVRTHQYKEVRFVPLQ